MYKSVEKVAFTYESLKSKFSLILFVYNLINGWRKLAEKILLMKRKKLRGTRVKI